MKKPDRQKLRKEWESRVVEYQASGQSGSAWCAANNLKSGQLWYWVNKLKQEEAKDSPATKWVPLEVRESSDGSEKSLIIKVGQAVIEVKPGFDPTLLTEVVRSLKPLC